MNYTKKILENGLTIVTVPMKDNPSVTVLVVVKTGSSYETKSQNGLSHFLEHMCFKGTTKRPTALDISRELDGIGSQHNAFTAQEFTGYFAKSHPKHFSKILDVVSDIYLNQVFDLKEIEKEKGVIVEEINMYEDIPQSLVSNLFMEVMYGDQPAGWTIAGPRENVMSMTQKDFVNYRNAHYVAGATTIFVAGNIDEKQAVAEVETLFVRIPQTKKSGKIATAQIQNKPNIKIKQKKTDQTHLIIGVRAYDAHSDKKYALDVLNAVLGGGMSSRLFQKLREEMGVGYYVHSRTDDYTDHCYLAVSTGVDTKRVSEVVSAILGEMKKITSEKVSEEELQKAKEYMIGNMYLGLESSDSLAEYYAMQDVLGDKILTPDELSKKIQAVTAHDVQIVAREIFVNEKLNMAIVGNIQNEKDIENIFHF